MTVARFLPRFQQAYRDLDQFAAREGASRTDIEAWQLERLNQVWSHAQTQVPYYRRLAAAGRFPHQFGSLDEFRARMPLLPKATVRETPDQIISEAPQPGSWRRTGGSTGTPMKCYWGKEAHREMLRAKYRFLAMWGVDIFDRTVYLWGHSGSFAPGIRGPLARLRQPLEDRLRHRLRLSAYRLGRDDLRRYLHQIGQFRPVAAYGYSSALNLLAQEAEATQFHCDSLKLMILTGEPAFPHIVERLERVFAAPATTEYGSIECGAIAMTFPDRTLRVREDVVLVETLPREDGRYDLVVSVLNNPSFPLLRYAIGDVTDAPLALPPRGFAMLSNVAGRNNDFIVTRGGRLLHSSRFDAFFKYETRNTRRFRVRQQADGALTVTVELTARDGTLPVAELERKLSALVEGFPVELHVADRIPLSLAGKHRLVVSDMFTDSGRPQSPRGEEELPAAEPRPAPAPAAPGSLPVEEPQGTSGPRKATRLRQLIESPELTFVMEAHNGLSARIVEEAGFEAIWASGLSMSASLGVRDSNEASWTQVLEVLEFMGDASRIPILVDGDTGYGNFNNMRRLVRKLEQRNIAGVCIEDKLFPKTNSFIRGTSQALADIDEFCGRIKAGKDAQSCDDFVIVARCEAFIAGWGLEEALRRSEAYHAAGANAILIHSAKRSADEILAFKQHWGDRCPVVIVPTKYYATPTDVFRAHRFSAVIWANHMLRSAITAMQRTAQRIFEEQSLIDIEERVASVGEVFRLQGAPELEEAEKRYLPRGAQHTQAVILATEQGPELGSLTATKPRCMVPIGDGPLLAHVLNAYRSAGIRDVIVVRGYCKDAVQVACARYFDDPRPDPANDAAALLQALTGVEEDCLVSPGHVLFKKFLPQLLLDTDADFAIVVDSLGTGDPGRAATAVPARCSHPNTREAAFRSVLLQDLGFHIPAAQANGVWPGFLKLSARGVAESRRLATEWLRDQPRLTLAELLANVLRAGHEIRVIYTSGNWLNVDTLEDVVSGGLFL